jgi:hypothetical protein
MMVSFMACQEMGWFAELGKMDGGGGCVAQKKALHPGASRVTRGMKGQSEVD